MSREVEDKADQVCAWLDGHVGGKWTAEPAKGLYYDFNNDDLWIRLGIETLEDREVDKIKAALKGGLETYPGQRLIYMKGVVKPWTP